MNNNINFNKKIFSADALALQVRKWREKNEKIIFTNGCFDILHNGHLEILASAANLGGKLIVALNSDDWLIAKKGKNFLPFIERKLILEHMEMVDEVIEFDDDELGSSKNALYKVKEKYPNDEVIFCNGG